jgi:hypothetical protein
MGENISKSFVERRLVARKKELLQIKNKKSPQT